MAQNNLGREKFSSWTPETWQAIDQAVLDQVGAIRVAQMVFHPSTDGNGQNVPDDTITVVNGKLSIPEGGTKPYVELSVDFALTPAQAENEATLHTARTLAMESAKAIAQAEDLAFFRGAPEVRTRAGTAYIGGARVANKKTVQTGLLSLPNIHTEPVPGLAGPAGPPWGENAFTAAVNGISHLTGKHHPGPYALMLALDVHADAFVPVAGTLTTTADRLTPLLAGGFYAAAAIPNQFGLLVSLGGHPTTLYVDQDAITAAFPQQDDDGNYQLRVFERVQIVPRDVTAFVKLAYQ